jgi:hypothetical protein
MLEFNHEVTSKHVGLGGAKMNTQVVFVNRRGGVSEEDFETNHLGWMLKSRK